MISWILTHLELLQWHVKRVHHHGFKMTHLNAPASRDQTLEQIYHRNEQEKKRQYNYRVMQIEQGTFTPLVYSTVGGMVPECQNYTKHQAERIA